MKKITFTMLVTFFVQCAIVNGQGTTGLPFLSDAKTKIEASIRKMNKIPDSSTVYISVYNRLNDLYIKNASSYNSYRSEMIQCVLRSSTSNKARKCLSDATPDLKNSLDSLVNLTDWAYNQYYHHKGGIVNQEGKGGIVNQIASGICGSLVDGLVKVLSEIHGNITQAKEAITKEINSDKYDLKPFDELLSFPERPCKVH